MPRMFMSYRRTDTISESGRIHDHLEREFGGRNVFKDVDDIQPGYDFRKVLEDEVSKCDVLLVMIGPNWATATDLEGNLRLFNPDDFVRIEVESGLKRGDDVLVIPVLVNNATMPKVSQLPPSLQELTYRNAVIIRNDPDFNRDMRRLIDYVRRYTKSKRTAVSPRWMGGGVIVVALLLLGLLALNGGNPSAPGVDTSTPTIGDSVATSPTTPVEVVTTLENSDYGDLYLSAQTEASNGNYADAISLYSQIIDAEQDYAPAYVGRALAYSSGFGDYSAAIDDLKQAIQLDPQYAEAYRYLGLFQSYEGEMDDVEANLQRALQLNPADVEAHLWLAEYYMNVGNYEGAADLYDALLNTPEALDNNQLYETWMGKGYTQSVLNDNDGALLSYDNARTVNPDRPEAYAAIGNLQVYLGKYEEAISNLNQVIEIVPDDPDNYYTRGIANMELQRYTEAISDFNRKLQLSPNDVDAYIGRGRVYSALGDYESAIADFGQAIRRDDTYAEAYFWRGITHFDNEYYQLAIDDFSTTIDMEYLTGESYGYRGLSYQYSGDGESAQEDLETALDYGVSDDLRYLVLTELGWIILDDDSSKAIDLFAEAIILDPSQTAAYEGEADVFLEAANTAENDREAFNDWVSAVDSLSRGIDNVPDNAYLYFKRGTVHEEIGLNRDDADYLRQAVTDFETAIEYDDTMVDAYIHLAEVALVLDDYSNDDALSYARSAYALNDHDTYAISTLASVYQVMGNYDKAREFYQLAIDFSEDDNEREAYQRLYDAVP